MSCAGFLARQRGRATTRNRSKRGLLLLCGRTLFFPQDALHPVANACSRYADPEDVIDDTIIFWSSRERRGRPDARACLTVLGRLIVISRSCLRTARGGTDRMNGETVRFFHRSRKKSQWPQGASRPRAFAVSSRHPHLAGIGGQCCLAQQRRCDLLHEQGPQKKKAPESHRDAARELWEGVDRISSLRFTNQPQ